MTNETTQTQGLEGLYEQLVRGAQELTRQISSPDGSRDFSDFMEEHNGLLRKYIGGFDSLNQEQYIRASVLLGQTKSYISGALDVQRSRSISESLKQHELDKAKTRKY